MKSLQITELTCFLCQAALAGVSHAQFTATFSRIDGASLPFLQPAFTPEFHA